MAARVVADANALMLPFEQRLQIEAELERLLGSYEVLVPEPVLKELAVLASEAKGRRRECARMALSLAARFTHRPGTGRGDTAVLNVARQESAALLTNDRELIRRALAAGLTVIRVKGKSHLVLETRQGEVR